MSATGLIERTEMRRQAVSEALDDRHRSRLGQFFTPCAVADFLASLLALPERGRFVVLDPGAGVGSLTAAVVARVLRERPDVELHVVAFEIDASLRPHLRATLVDCERTAADVGCAVTTELRAHDFVSWAVTRLSELARGPAEAFSACVMNPPYRKIGARSTERHALERLGLRVTNLYPAFVALAASLLDTNGQLSAITPRSFANGPYFEDFRRYMLDRVALERIHVFERRGDVFGDTRVLQENVVFLARRSASPSTVTLSVSAGYEDQPQIREVDARRVVRPDDPHLFIRIPVNEGATVVAERIVNLPANLADLDVSVSTGRVVDFRVREHLMHDPDPELAVPLIYPSHLRGGGVVWPLLGGKKPNALERHARTVPLMLPAETYVLVKRFTAKEERRRVVASVFGPDDVDSGDVAFENHLNVFHRDGRGLPPSLAIGLAAYLNCGTVDAYVRQFSGHTQINATDLRLLRYPTKEQLAEIGRAILDAGGTATADVAGLVESAFDAEPSQRRAGDYERSLAA